MSDLIRMYQNLTGTRRGPIGLPNNPSPFRIPMPEDLNTELSPEDEMQNRINSMPDEPSVTGVPPVPAGNRPGAGVGRPLFDASPQPPVLLFENPYRPRRDRVLRDPNEPYDNTT